MIHLDTNIVVALLNERPEAMAGLAECWTAGQTVGISSIVLFELQYGASKSARRIHNEGRIAAFLESPIAVLAFDGAASESAGRIRADLEREGVPIGPFDVLIAGHALSADAVLVTNNTREFARVRGLRIADWLSSPAS